MELIRWGVMFLRAIGDVRPSSASVRQEGDVMNVSETSSLRRVRCCWWAFCLIVVLLRLLRRGINFDPNEANNS